MAENWPKIEDSAFLKYEKTESKDDDYLKKIDAFSTQEMMRNGEWNVDKLKKYWILDSKDWEKIKKEFNNFKKNFSEQLKNTDKDEKIENKLKDSFKKVDSYNSDFLVLWKMISWLKNDLVKKKVDIVIKPQEVTDKWLSDAENKEWNELSKLKPSEINNFYHLKKGVKVEKLDVKWKKNILKNYELYKNNNEDEKINKPLDKILEKNPVWEAIIWVFWKDVLKNLLNNSIIWKFLKWILNIFQDPKLDFNFSNKAEKLLWNVDWEIFKEWDFKKITKERWLENINKILESGKKLFWDKNTDVKDFFTEITKYDKWIISYSWDSDWIVWKESMRSKIQTKDIESAMFIKKEMNSQIDSKFDFKLWWVLSKVMDWKADEIWWDFTKQFENLKDVFKNKDVIRTVELDENNKTQLKVTFVKKEDFMDKIKEVWKSQAKKL